ncbi:MAG: ATP-dependent DNA helicase RecG [Deltaproteobacteria bacterium]|nr:ATP-dependent DNA helicase RecG [Deltaproteobacteria bacterium]
MAQSLKEILTAILKPLSFASKDNFVHLNSVKSIEPLIFRLCEEASSLGLPNDMNSRFTELKSLFYCFDSHTSDNKKEKITKAIDLINSISAAKPKTPAIPVEEAKKRLELLNTPLEFVKGVGPKLAERLGKKGLNTVEDMLYYLPLRYEDRRKIKKIRELTPGSNEVTTGEVAAFGETRYGRRRVYEVVVTDGSALLKLKWFNYHIAYMKNKFTQGQQLLVFGTISAFGNQKEIIHPDIERIEKADLENPQDFGGIMPIYSQIENFHQKTIRKIVRNLVEGYCGYALGGVPEDVRERTGLLDLNKAFREAHLPTDIASNKPMNPALAKKSLVFDELFMLELGLALKRNQIKKEAGISFNNKGSLEEMLRGLLPFKLTGAQERTLKEVKKDMLSAHPMNRLIQGDVGSGKTVVSFIAALNAIEAGYQSAIMAPTEILAEQHFINIHRYAESLGIKALLLTGSMSKAIKSKALEAIRGCEVDLVIGTHALIQKDVEFKKLGLIVIDEQHRFGVVQRAALKKKGFGAEKEISPDFLIMTATPIPRTLSMTVFGDLDVSVIDELPPGRKPVFTKILRDKDRLNAYRTIRQEIEAGSQCYIVYPLVEESKELSLKDATNMKEHLQKDIFTEFKVGLLHGRMKAADKEAVMKDFKEKRLDILVSTTVIEVGVDVPNATIMLVEHAERFGLAQLHQLRGRVGRGQKKSYCLLMAEWTNSEDTYKRLKVMEDTQDGFKIAEEDLKIRGPGDFLGTRQAGLPDFRTAEALTDLAILKKARDEAFNYLVSNPELSGQEGAVLKLILKSRWTGRLELAEIG